MQSVNYEVLMSDILRENMSEDGFKLWTAMLTKIFSIWERPTSSTGKYHNKDDGRVPTVAEHTYEMLYAATKVMRMYGAEPKSVEADILLLGIALHDAWKYGENPKSRNHTANAHDMIAADMLRKNKDVILQLYSEEKYDILEESIRFHQGRWSTNVPSQDNFDWSTYHPYTQFIHTLDMLSANNCIHSNNQPNQPDQSKQPSQPSPQPQIDHHISGMQVKVDETIYDSTKQPIMIILTPKDKSNIANMAPEATKYCAYPDNMSQESVKEWMSDLKQSNDIPKQEQNIDETDSSNMTEEFNSFIESINLEDMSI